MGKSSSTRTPKARKAPKRSAATLTGPQPEEAAAAPAAGTYRKVGKKGFMLVQDEPAPTDAA